MKVEVSTINGKEFHRHRCPGCNSVHLINVEWPLDNGAKWSFNGDFDNPTFHPSVNISVHFGEEGIPDQRCHYVITNGKIKYESDTTHSLSGQTVDLPEIC